MKITNIKTQNIRIGPKLELGYTIPNIETDAGVYFAEHGGYYAGGNIIVNGTEYAVSIAPVESGAIYFSDIDTTRRVRAIRKVQVS